MERIKSEVLDCAVIVDLEFFIERPKSVPEKKRTYPEVSPDVDKLVRAVLDSLTGPVLSNDSRVVDLSATKRYCEAKDAGVKIKVKPK